MDSCCNRKSNTLSRDKMAEAFHRNDPKVVQRNKWFVALAIILLIGSVIATGCTYSKLGPNSLYIVGATFVVFLISILKATRCCKPKDENDEQLQITKQVLQQQIKVEALANGTRIDLKIKLTDEHKALLEKEGIYSVDTQEGTQLVFSPGDRIYGKEVSGMKHTFSYRIYDKDNNPKKQLIFGVYSSGDLIINIDNFSGCEITEGWVENLAFKKPRK